MGNKSLRTSLGSLGREGGGLKSRWNGYRRLCFFRISPLLQSYCKDKGATIFIRSLSLFSSYSDADILGKKSVTGVSLHYVSHFLFALLRTKLAPSTSAVVTHRCFIFSALWCHSETVAAGGWESMGLNVAGPYSQIGNRGISWDLGSSACRGSVSGSEYKPEYHFAVKCG